MVELPLGLFGVALGTVILPHLSRRHADTDTVGFSRSLDWGLRTVLLLALPAAAGLFSLAEPLAATIFQRGQFDAHASAMVALSLSALCPAIPAFMLTKVLNPAFYSRQDTRTPMRAAIITVAVNIGLMALIVTPLWKYEVVGAHAGIALATALAGITNTTLLWRYLRRDRLWQPEPGWGRALMRIGLAVAAMVLVLILLRQGPWPWQDLHGVVRWAWLFGTILTGALTYLGVLLLLGWRPQELRHST